MFSTITLFMTIFGPIQLAVPTIPPVQQLPAAPAIQRTQAVSALRSLVRRKGDAMVGLTRSVNDGKDYIIACVEDIFNDWGAPVYNSVVASPEAHDEPAMNIYLDASDSRNKNLAIITAGRSDLMGAVRSVRSEMIIKGVWPQPPADLSFATFPQYDPQYLHSLSMCGDNSFLAEVDSRVAPMKEDIEIDGATLVDARGVDLGTLPNENSGNGMVAGIVPSTSVEGVRLVIPDKTSIYSKKQKYSDWIRALSNE